MVHCSGTTRLYVRVFLFLLLMCRNFHSPGGIEKQYRCLCKHCGCVLGYSSTPFDEKVKHIFLLPDAIKTHCKIKVTQHQHKTIIQERIHIIQYT